MDSVLCQKDRRVHGFTRMRTGMASFGGPESPRVFASGPASGTFLFRRGRGVRLRGALMSRPCAANLPYKSQISWWLCAAIIMTGVAGICMFWLVVAKRARRSVNQLVGFCLAWLLRLDNSYFESSCFLLI